MTVAFERALRLLCDAGVEHIVIGGVAAALHGAARTTIDLDVVYRRTDANISRLVAALAPYAPYLRGAPPGLPFMWDTRTVGRGLNFTLTSSVGDIDLLGEVSGMDYEALLSNSVETDEEGLRIRVVDLPTLIRLKRAAGRPKDHEAIAELEILLEESERRADE